MDPQANVKWGARLIPSYDGKMEITAIVTGVSSPHIVGRPISRKEAKRELGYDIEVIG